MVERAAWFTAALALALAAVAQENFVDPSIWDDPRWHRGRISSGESVETTYRTLFDKLEECMLGYSFRVRGELWPNGSTSKELGPPAPAEILVLMDYRQLVYPVDSIYMAFRISPRDGGGSEVSTFQSTRFSDVFVAAVPGWLADAGAPCRK